MTNNTKTATTVTPQATFDACTAVAAKAAEKGRAPTVLQLLKAAGYDKPRSKCKATRAATLVWASLGLDRATFTAQAQAIKSDGFNDVNANNVAIEWQNARKYQVNTADAVAIGAALAAAAEPAADAEPAAPAEA